MSQLALNSARLSRCEMYRGVRQALTFGSVAGFAVATLFAAAHAAESSEILLNASTLDTTSARAASLSSALSSGGKSLRLVQFDGPVRASEHAALRSTGVQIVDYIPNNAYLVYGDAAAITKVRMLAQSNTLQWEGDYAPELKINHMAWHMGAKAMQPDYYAIQLVLDPAANAETLALIAALAGGGDILQNTFRHYVNIKAEVSLLQLTQIAQRPDVISIMPEFTPVLFDERATLIMANQVSGTPSRCRPRATTSPGSPRADSRRPSSTHPHSPSTSPIRDSTTAPTCRITSDCSWAAHRTIPPTRPTALSSTTSRKEQPPRKTSWVAAAGTAPG